MRMLHIAIAIYATDHSLFMDRSARLKFKKQSQENWTVCIFRLRHVVVLPLMCRYGLFTLPRLGGNSHLFYSGDLKDILPCFLTTNTKTELKMASVCSQTHMVHIHMKQWSWSQWISICKVIRVFQTTFPCLFLIQVVKQRWFKQFR